MVSAPHQSAAEFRDAQIVSGMSHRRVVLRVLLDTRHAGCREQGASRSFDDELWVRAAASPGPKLHAPLSFSCVAPTRLHTSIARRVSMCSCITGCTSLFDSKSNRGDLVDSDTNIAAIATAAKEV